MTFFALAFLISMSLGLVSGRRGRTVPTTYPALMVVSGLALSVWVLCG